MAELGRVQFGDATIEYEIHRSQRRPRKSTVAFSRCYSPEALPSLVVRQRTLEAGQGFVLHALPVSGEAKLTLRDKVDV